MRETHGAHHPVGPYQLQASRATNLAEQHYLFLRAQKVEASFL